VIPKPLLLITPASLGVFLGVALGNVFNSGGIAFRKPLPSVIGGRFVQICLSKS
jgi:hypothetical protein